MLQGKIGPVAIILATILIPSILISGVLIAVARSDDARQLMIEKTIVESALRQLRENLAGAIVQDAYWDAAYDRIGDKVDQKWVEQQFVSSSVGAGVTMTIIARSDGRPIYSVGSGVSPAISDTLTKEADLRTLVLGGLGKPALPAAPMTGFVRVGGKLYIGAAERIVPNDDRAKGRLDKHFALAFLAPLDALQLQRLETDFHINAVQATAIQIPGLAQIALPDARGHTIGYLSWKAATPGDAFVARAAPFAWAAFLLAGLLQLIVLRSWMRAAQREHDEGVAKTMFLANISHELRTPLNAIIGFSECMTGQVFGPLNARYREYATDIYASGQHLLGIVNDVLDLTQLQHDPNIAFMPIPLASAIAGPMRMLREYAKGQQIVIAYYDQSNGAQVIANEKAISQILLNLGSNAVKFSPAGSTVDVITRITAGFVEIVVRDHGTGMAEDKLRLIGQPFFQAHNATSRKPGSGLGLAIVKTLAARLNGQLVIESELGVGTTAILRLPLHQTANSAVAEAAAA